MGKKKKKKKKKWKRIIHLVVISNPIICGVPYITVKGITIVVKKKIAKKKKDKEV